MIGKGATALTLTQEATTDLREWMAPSSPTNPASILARPEWRGEFESQEVNALHAKCFKHRLFDDDWWTQVNRYSLGWICTRQSGNLVGFVNVAWDGGRHAFILDIMVNPEYQHQGIAKALIEEAVARAKETACEWLHVDFEPHLRPFYFDACGFRPTDAGLTPLK